MIEALPIYDNAGECYLPGIKVYDLTYWWHRNHDGDCNASCRLQLGSYDALGNFAWHSAAASAPPSWLFNATNFQCSEAWFRGAGVERSRRTQGKEVVKY